MSSDEYMVKGYCPLDGQVYAGGGGGGSAIGTGDFYGGDGADGVVIIGYAK